MNVISQSESEFFLAAFSMLQVMWGPEMNKPRFVGLQMPPPHPHGHAANMGHGDLRRTTPFCGLADASPHVLV